MFTTLFLLQVSQEAGQVVWYSHLFQNFPQFIVILLRNLYAVRKQQLELDMEQQTGSK